MRAQFTPPGIDPAITRYIPRDFVPERHARASSFAHSWTISDCFGIQPYAHAVDGGEPSVHRVFSIELVNVCGGLSLEDRLRCAPQSMKSAFPSVHAGSHQHAQSGTWRALEHRYMRGRHARSAQAHARDHPPESAQPMRARAPVRARPQQQWSN